MAMFVPSFKFSAFQSLFTIFHSPISTHSAFRNPHSLLHAPLVRTQHALPSAFCLLLTAFCLVPSVVLAQRAPSGPFALRDQFPVKLLFLSLRPESGYLLPTGARQWAFGLSYTNTYAGTWPVGNPKKASDYYQAAPLNEYRLFVDAEVLRLTIDLDWRIARRLQVGATLPLIFQNGGFLDSSVEGFHGLFNLTNGGREETPQNAYGVFVVRNAQFWINREKAAAFQPGDMVLRLKSPILEGGSRGPIIAGSGAVKLPTGRFESLTGSGGVDIQVALMATQAIGQRLAVHYSIAYTHLGRPSRHIDFPIRSITSQMLALEYLTTNKLSVLLQTLANTSPFPDSVLGPLDRTAYEMHGGIKYAISPAALFEVSITENLSQYQNTPDIGLYMGVRWRR